MRTRVRWSALFVVLGLLLTVIPVWGEDLPTAVDVVKSAADSLRTAHSFQAAYTLSLTTTGPGGDFNLEVPLVIAVEKPNKFRLEAKTPLFRATIVGDGSKIWAYLPDQKQVMSYPSPESLNLAKIAPQETQAQLKMIPVAALAFISQYGKLVGVEKLKGIDTYQLEVGLNEVSVRLWIGKDDGMIYRVETNADMHLSSLMGHMNVKSEKTKEKVASANGPVKIALIAKHISVNQPIAPELFRFRVPEGVKVVENASLIPNTPETPQPKDK